MVSLGKLFQRLITLMLSILLEEQAGTGQGGMTLT